MADTIITNSPEKNNGDSGAGWFLAIVIIIALVIVGIVLYKNGVFSKQPTSTTNSSTNINLTVPNPTGNNSGNTGTNGY